MKSKDIRELALRLYNDGCSGNEIHRSLRGLISRRTIFYGLKLLKVTGAIALQDPSGCPRQNEKIYAATRNEADEKGAVHHKAKFPAGVMVWVEVCSQGITRPVIIENGTIDSDRYIADILPVALKDGTQMLGNEFIFQQDGAKPHTAKNT
ncbi:unnamed protein product [Rotaria socialis]|uniref:Transposase n=1 Tax=Rotaria socialis TaxID=392032 RepID=A0A817Y0J5_9BILA|nr:unnamed protein product [Rotaria socialis]CAF4674527.1 unnamed protein product [Rotaria socialis]